MLQAVALSIALAMDATAVAAARGVSGGRARDLALLAAVFGLFQAGMAGAGLAIGAAAASRIAAWDHWLAFGLLALIGGKMLIDAIAGSGAPAAPAPLRPRLVLVLAVATSVDALAAGVTLPILSAPPAVSLVLIGAVSFVLSFAGGLAGSALGDRFGPKLEIIGGLTLIAIGIKTVVDHVG